MLLCYRAQQSVYASVFIFLSTVNKSESAIPALSKPSALAHKKKKISRWEKIDSFFFFFLFLLLEKPIL